MDVLQFTHIIKTVYGCVFIEFVCLGQGSNPLHFNREKMWVSSENATNLSVKAWNYQKYNIITESKRLKTMQ